MSVLPDKTLCGVIGAGQVADDNAVAKQLAACGLILCADGGLSHCRRMGLTPHLLLGDFDSIREDAAGIPRLTYPADKNYTDCMLAVEEGIRRGFRRFYMSGVLGGRLDHTLANFQILGRCAKDGLEACLDDGVTSVYAVASELTIAPRPRHYFSLVPLSGMCRGVTILGGRFPLDDYDLAYWDPRAISNEFTGQPVTVTLREGALGVIVTPGD